MNAAQIKIVGQMVTESVLDFLAARYNTTAKLIAEAIALGHEKLTAEFCALVKTGMEESFSHFMG